MQRVVRDSFGRFRYCYEQGLQRFIQQNCNPSPTGPDGALDVAAIKRDFPLLAESYLRGDLKLDELFSTAVAQHHDAECPKGALAQLAWAAEKVPGADKLSVCKVNDGRGERTIICGAPNHQPGDKVPLILPNFALPLKPGEKEPFVIKERKVFGITSQGMMCSPQELGLPDPVDGLLILRADAQVGQPFAEYLGRPGGDVVYDLGCGDGLLLKFLTGTRGVKGYGIEIADDNVVFVNFGMPRYRR